MRGSRDYNFEEKSGGRVLESPQRSGEQAASHPLRSSEPGGGAPRTFRQGSRRAKPRGSSRPRIGEPRPGSGREGLRLKPQGPTIANGDGSLPGNALSIRQRAGVSDDHTRLRYPDHGRDLWSLRSLSHRVERIRTRSEPFGLFAGDSVEKRTGSRVRNAFGLSASGRMAFRAGASQVESPEGVPRIGPKQELKGEQP